MRLRQPLMVLAAALAVACSSQPPAAVEKDAGAATAPADRKYLLERVDE